MGQAYETMTNLDPCIYMIYIWVQSFPYLNISIYMNVYVCIAIDLSKVVLGTPQHLHVGVLWHDPIYI